MITPTILQTIHDPNLFKPWFYRKGRDASSWAAWFVLIAAIFGLPISDEDLATYHALTGRNHAPTRQAKEVWAICGRRAGKSFMLALIATYLACFKNYKEFLQPGEAATILVIASDRKQARTILRYIRGFLQHIPLLAAMVVRETAEGFELENRVIIEVGTASHRTTRGYTLAACLCDEVAYWQQEGSASPDVEILNALRPALVTIPGSMLLAASSPFGKRGALYDNYKRHYGVDDDPTLVIHAPTRALNPNVKQETIDAAIEADPVAAASEFMAEFRSDADRLITPESVQACVADKIFEREPSPLFTYSAFCDPSGGAQDSFTLSIAHQEDDLAVLDLIRERKPPFDPSLVVAEYAMTLRVYGLTTVTGDRYSGEWVREAFRKFGIIYKVSEKTKSDLYLTLLPMINSQRVRLLDDKRLTSQLIGLERRVARGGRENVDHGTGGHDDVANSVAGALTLCAKPAGKVYFGTHREIGAPINWVEVGGERQRAWRRGRVIENNVRVN